MNEKNIDQSARAGAAMGAFLREVSAPKHIDESKVTKNRVLVMTYTAHYTLQTTVRPGPGGTAQAIDEVHRWIAGQPNVDAASIRYRVEDC